VLHSVLHRKVHHTAIQSNTMAGVTLDGVSVHMMTDSTLALSSELNVHIRHSSSGQSAHGRLRYADPLSGIQQWQCPGTPGTALKQDDLLERANEPSEQCIL